jgi:raffinose/stachyose/melibiose transport system substrate-binding protein
MKKILAILLVAALSLALVAACGNGQGSGPAANEPITIRHANVNTPGGPLHDIYMGLVTEFNADNPDIIIEPDIQPSAEHRTKLMVEFTAGNPPEVSQVPINFLVEFARSDLIYYWEPILDANPHIRDRFAPNILNNMAINGRISSLPIEASIDGLMINTAIFEANGWNPPATFEDMIDLAGKARDVGIHLMVTGGADIRFAWLASAFLARTAGFDTAIALTQGDAMDQWNNPDYGFPAVLEHFAKLVEAEAFPADVLGFSTLEADQFFARGEAAMYYEGAWKAANFNTAGGREFVDNVARIEFPAFPNARPGGDPNIRVGGNVWGLTIPAGLNERQMDAVTRFADAYTAPEYNAKYMESGARVAAGLVDWDRSLTLPLFNQFVDAYRASDRLLLSMDALTVPAIDFAIKQTAMPGIIAGTMTVQEAIDFVQMTAEEHLRTLD